jgi:hypothetical protein
VGQVGHPIGLRVVAGLLWRMNVDVLSIESKGTADTRLQKLRPSSKESHGPLSLRAKRSEAISLVNCGSTTRLPRRFAPRNDKVDRCGSSLKTENFKLFSILSDHQRGYMRGQGSGSCLKLRSNRLLSAS